VREAVARGVDGLTMAGGDGSQALVAAIAAEHDLPYACMPSGTRNHFALDLGVDRKDVVGALGAFIDGGERYVDLAEVDGKVFAAAPGPLIRIAHSHPGASPSADVPRTALGGVKELVRAALR
jgi:diacylglycerol kinase family enzyme